MLEYVKTLKRYAGIGAFALVATLIAAPDVTTAQTPAAQTPVPPAEQSAPVQDRPPEEETGAHEASLIRPAVGTSLGEWRWRRRPVVVFADSPNNPSYIQQMENITERVEPLVDRDVIVITDTDPSARSSFRQSLRPRDFMVVVMGKDGTIILRRPVPLSVSEISRSINKLPLRQRDMHESRTTED